MSQVKEITVTVKVKSDTIVRISKVEQMAKLFFELPVSDQERLTKIINNPKALKGLEDNWNILESMFS
jgi:hypothetical protein